MKKNKKYWKRRFGGFNADEMTPYHQHLDFRRVDRLDDEGLAYLLTNVKGVDMLDLNQTEITNKSIALLAGMEYIKELRMKDIKELTDDCCDDLNKIKGLEFLHVRNTAITIDGILKLKDLVDLKTLMFSADDVEAIKEKMRRLRALLPGCEFVVNSRPYSFEENTE